MWTGQSKIAVFGQGNFSASFEGISQFFTPLFSHSKKLLTPSSQPIYQWAICTNVGVINHMKSRTRREFLSCCAIAAGAFLLSDAQADAQGFDSGDFDSTEEQASDPEDLRDRHESLKYTAVSSNGYCESSWGYCSDKQQPLFEKKDAETLIQSLLTLSKAYADDGVSRTTTPEIVTRYLSVFDLPFKYPEGNYVPYCAAGLSYALCRSYSKLIGLEPSEINLRKVMKTVNRYYLFPSPSVRDIQSAAVARNTWLDGRDKPQPKPGWPIIFSWSADQAPNHIGLTVSSTDAEITTVEYNTSTTISGSNRNGGVVAIRTRKYNRNVLGFVKTY